MKKILLSTTFSLCGFLIFAQGPAIAWQKLIGGTGNDYGKIGLITSNNHFVVLSDSSSKSHISKFDINGNLLLRYNTNSSESFMSTSYYDMDSYLSGPSSAPNYGNSISIIKHDTIFSSKTFLTESGKPSLGCEICSHKILNYSLLYTEKKVQISFMRVQTSSPTYPGGLYWSTTKVGGFALPDEDILIDAIDYGSSDVLVLTAQKVIKVEGYYKKGFVINNLVSTYSFNPKGIIAGINGDFYVYGTSKANNWGYVDGIILKFGTDGSFKWAKYYGGTKNDSFNKIIKGKNGGFYVVGNTNSTTKWISSINGLSDAWILKMNNEFEAEWQANYGGTGDDNFNSMVINKDSSLFIVGTSSSNDRDLAGAVNNGQNDIWALKLKKDTLTVDADTTASLNKAITDGKPTVGLIFKFYFNNNFKDSGGKNHAMYSFDNTYGLTLDRFGSTKSAYTFNSKYTEMYLSSVGDFSGMPSALTISMWVKIPPYSGTEKSVSLLKKFSSCETGEGSYLLKIDDKGFLNFDLMSEGNSTVKEKGSIKLNDDKWHHVVAIWDKPNVVFYIDDVIDNAGSFAPFEGPIKYTTYSVSFGKPSWEYCGVAKNTFSIDDVLMYDIPLSAKQVDSLYSEGDYVTRNEEITNIALRIYPNPSLGTFNFEGLKNGYEINMMDMTGQLILNQNIKSENEKVNISFAPSGVYFYKITYIDGSTSRGKLVKN